MTRMGLSFVLRSSRRLLAKITTSRQFVPANVTASFQNAVTRMLTPAEAIIATTAGRSEVSTPCSKESLR